MPALIVPCPSCSKAVDWSASSPTRPFCSERCKLIDLGSWANESYRVIDRSQDGLSIDSPLSRAEE